MFFLDLSTIIFHLLSLYFFLLLLFLILHFLILLFFTLFLIHHLLSHHFLFILFFFISFFLLCIFFLLLFFYFMLFLNWLFFGCFFRCFFLSQIQYIIKQIGRVFFSHLFFLRMCGVLRLVSLRLRRQILIILFIDDSVSCFVVSFLHKFFRCILFFMVTCWRLVFGVCWLGLLILSSWLFFSLTSYCVLIRWIDNISGFIGQFVSWSLIILLGVNFFGNIKFTLKFELCTFCFVIKILSCKVKNIIWLSSKNLSCKIMEDLRELLRNRVLL